MSGRDFVLAQGIAAARAGDRQAARRLLTEAAQRDPGSELAWLWLSGVLDTTQGRSYCLHKVLEINPANEVARCGLAVLAQERAARALVVRAAPDSGDAGAAAASPPAGADPGRVPDAGEGRRWAARARAAAAGLAAGIARHRRQPAAVQARRRGRDLLVEPRFWQVSISCLAVVALGLVAVLLYSTLGLAAPPEAKLAEAVVVPASPTPHGTLRPTFTATATPTPTATPSPTFTPTFTPTPVPTETPQPTATATSVPAPRSVRRPAAIAPTAAPAIAPAARPTLPPRSWDARLDALGVRVEPVGIPEGQMFWRLVEARWADEQQSAGKHSIFIEVLDCEGRRVVGQPVIVQWADGSVALPVENRPFPDWGVDFGMYNCLGSYAVSVGGAPSDRIVGLGLGTLERPNFTIHTSFYLVFRLAQR